MSAHDGHLHLAVARPKPAWDWARWLVVALGVAGGALFVLAFFQTWWSFWLYAPQYPGGLRLTISLTGMSGDVKEIDLLNHYIGMSHLEDAAPVERHLAGYGVAAIATLSLALLVASGKRLNKLIAIPAVAFPVAFLADSFYWLYTFGHRLDPRAPLKIGTFTPQLFGNGKIGQFETYATPSLGFWLAVLGVGCIVLAAVLRGRVCASCTGAGTCGASCSRFMILPDRGKGRT
jgi:copper chaperone NosL